MTVSLRQAAFLPVLQTPRRTRLQPLAGAGSDDVDRAANLVTQLASQSHTTPRWIKPHVWLALAVQHEQVFVPWPLQDHIARVDLNPVAKPFVPVLGRVGATGAAGLAVGD